LAGIIIGIDVFFTVSTKTVFITLEGAFLVLLLLAHNKEGLYYVMHQLASLPR
jgi:hypothetical protein